MRVKLLYKHVDATEMVRIVIPAVVKQRLELCDDECLTTIPVVYIKRPTISWLATVERLKTS